MTDSVGIGKSLLKNNIAMLFSRAIQPVFTFILSVYIARFLGASGLGSFSFIITFFGIFSTFSLLGLCNLAVREIIWDRSNVNKILVNFSALGLISTSFFLILMCGAIYLVKYPNEVRVSVCLIGLSLLPVFLLQIYESIFIALEKVIYMTSISLLISIFRTTISIFLLFLGFKLITLIGLLVIFNIINLLFYVSISFHLIGKPVLKIDSFYCKKIIRLMPTFFFICILASFLNSIPIIALSKVKNMTEVGIYSVAYKFILLWALVSNGFVCVTMPIFSRIFLASRKKYEEISKKFIGYAIIVVPVLLIVLAVIANQLIVLLFGAEFKGSINALYILSLMLFLLPVNGLLGNIITASNNQKFDLISLIIGSIFGLIFHPFLAYNWGYIGTSIATVVSLTIVTFFQYYFINQKLFSIKIFQIIKKPVIAIILAGIFILVFGQLPDFILGFLAIIVYVGVLVLLKTFPKNDLKLLKNIISMRDSSTGLEIRPVRNDGF